MNVRVLLVPVGMVLLVGCASSPKRPPAIVLDELSAPTEQTEKSLQAETAPAPPVEVVSIPEPLPLPGQLKPLSLDKSASTEKPADVQAGVVRALDEARVAPARDGFINAVQLWPYAEGALYQVYASPGRVTLIALQPGEQLVTVAAGDTVRWIVGDTVSGSGNAQRVSVLVKPTRPDLQTNLVITTDRRTYLLELNATERTWMASVSWSYPRAQMQALTRARPAPPPANAGLVLEDLRFRYAIHGDDPPWKPRQAFDDGRKVYIQFPAGIAQGELPPLFVVGPQGKAQLVNYRFRAPYYVVDRLFAAAELRLGVDDGQVVRIERTDGVARRR